MTSTIVIIVGSILLLAIIVNWITKFDQQESPELLGGSMCLIRMAWFENQLPSLCN